MVARYRYDAWGNIVGVLDANHNEITDTNHIGHINPIRYRGYYYDTETSFYYLQSRYYNSEVGRFINCDSQINNDILGNNLYVYCGNNPINRIDASGEAWETAFDIISLGASIIDVWKNASDLWSWVGLIGDTIDLIPFVTGVGEAARAIKIGNKIVDTADTLGDVARKTTTTINKIANIVSDSGYSSFNKLKKVIGAPGEGKEWHHIVEQSQILKSGFSPEMIHNTGNIVAINRTTHRTISGYYSSIQPFTNGLTVRNWLAGQSYDYQYQFGIGVLEMFK